MLSNNVSEQEIRDILEQILKRREFHNEGEKSPLVKVLGSIWEAIKEWVRELLQYKQPNPQIRIDPDFGIKVPVLQTILKVLLILIAAILLFFLVRFIVKKVYLSGRIRKMQAPEAYEYLNRPDEAMENYYGYLSSKEYSKALRFLFIALLLELDKRKIIRIEKWKTNRMYIREIGQKEKKLIPQMQEFSALFNACCYGNRAVDEVVVGKWFDFYMNQKEKRE